MTIREREITAPEKQKSQVPSPLFVPNSTHPSCWARAPRALDAVLLAPDSVHSKIPRQTRRLISGGRALGGVVALTDRQAARAVAQKKKSRRGWKSCCVTGAGCSGGDAEAAITAEQANERLVEFYGGCARRIVKLSVTMMAPTF